MSMSRCRKPTCCITITSYTFNLVYPAAFIAVCSHHISELWFGSLVVEFSLAGNREASCRVYERNTAM